jgi:hypothetical protein
MLNYQNWLENTNTVRMCLVQAQALVADTLVTKYISTHSATVDGIQYLPIISGDITVDESISLNYSASISYGDIEIVNTTGEYDSWLDYVWVNKSIKIYIGSVPQPGVVASISDFELIFDGIVSDIDSKSRSRLNLKIRDKLEKLNTSISEVLLGNYFHGGILPDDPLNLTQYKNQYRNNLKPIVYGEVHNITPLLTDSSMLEYMVSGEAVEQIIEVRDNGVPVAFTQVGATYALPAGSFRLLKDPSGGTITCSVQGTKRTVNIAGSTSTNTYTNTISNTIADILKFRGLTIAYSEIDTASFSTIGSEYVGVYITDRINVLNICQDLAKSCAAVVTVSRAGKVKLVQLDIPTSATITITESDMLLNTLNISSKLEVLAGIKLGYAKNWTVQNNLLTAIPQEHKDLYATEYLESRAVDPTVADNYDITTEPVLENSYLIDKTQADAVALKKLNLSKTQRKVFSVNCTARLLNTQVGDAVRIFSSRFGLQAGVYGKVIATKPNWLKGTIELGILV